MTTIVTMFFDMSHLKDKNVSSRPSEFYIKNGIKVLQLPYPMIIFCDKFTKSFLESTRKKETSAPTIYIEKGLEEYDFYNHAWSIIRSNRDEKSDKNNSRVTPSYFLMGMFKPLALQIAHQRNDFNSKYYAWIDLGCSHVCRSVSEYAPIMIEYPKPKISVCYIHYRSHEELVNMEEFISNAGCGIASTAYTVEASLVAKFYTSMFSVFYEQLYRGVGHTDETVMTYVYDRYPELFTLYYGDYYSIFTNYHSPIEDFEGIKRFFINEAKKKNRPDLAKIAEDAIINAINRQK
jgi:hypothetical protein